MRKLRIAHKVREVDQIHREGDSIRIVMGEKTYTFTCYTGIGGEVLVREILGDNHGRNHRVEVKEQRGQAGWNVVYRGNTIGVEEGDQVEEDSAETEKSPEVRSPTQGRIRTIVVKNGDHVKEGDDLICIEFMKMENMIVATYSGVISGIGTEEGDVVSVDQLLLVVTPNTPPGEIDDS